MRRILMAAVAACSASCLAAGLGLAAAAPAGADPVPVAVATVDKAEAHRGETVTLTVTYTNPEAVPVTFGYLSVNPTYSTWSSGVDFTMTSCTGGITSCWFGQPQPWAAYMNPTTPLAPGASRTVTITYDIEPTSACGGGYHIAFFLYAYRESTAGFVGETLGGPATSVLC
jgi:hypothetical protein